MKYRIPFAAAAIVLASFGATAADVFHPANNEPGAVNHVVPGKLTRAERAALDRQSQANRDAFSVFAGEESGWQLKQHGYAFSNGRLVHADQIPHDTRAPRFTTAEAIAMEAQYRGN